MKLQLEGKVVMVTGASAGIGREVSRQFAAEGATVVALARRAALLDALVGEESSAGRIIAIPTDVTSSEGRVQAVDKIIADHGQIDVLINNAGYSTPPGYGISLPIDADDEPWRAAFELNFHAARQLAHLVLPYMLKAASGCIINVTGNREPATLNASVAAKAALHAWAKGLSRDVAAAGVRVNNVIPGRIHSEQVDERVYRDPADRDAFIRDHIPFGRFGMPDEFAPLVVFLASAQANYITGQTIGIDGGMQRSV
jgi:3-oxoacyl-[acyl-carrier protein] reductase